MIPVMKQEHVPAKLIMGENIVIIVGKECMDFQIVKVIWLKILHLLDFFLQIFVFLTKDCNCNVDGSENAMVCDAAGHCTCKPNVAGYKCDKCAANQYGFPNCQGNINIHFFQFQMMFQRVIVNYRGKHIYFRL